MEKIGYIYLITNNINNKQYVGQTVRSINIRFNEHCVSKKPGLDSDIQKYGKSNFELELLEEVPVDLLDEREKFWIKEKNTFYNGYNLTEGGKVCPMTIPKAILIVEPNLIIPSRAVLIQYIHLYNDFSWEDKTISDKINECIENNKEFLGYHLNYVVNIQDLKYSSDEEIINWVKSLKISYNKKEIYCEELDKVFVSASEAARYCLDNKLYLSEQYISKNPFQTILVSISKNALGKSEKVDCIGGLHFYYTGNTSKMNNSSQGFYKNRIYCPQLDLSFDSQIEAAKYFIEQKLFGNISLKTAKLRISDIIRGAIKEYKGYSFQSIGISKIISTPKDKTQFSYRDENGKLHYTEETRRKMSESKKGKSHPISEETKKKLSENCPTKRQVRCKNTNEVFESLVAAATWAGLKKGSSISDACSGRRKTAGAHPETKERLQWEFV